jgi:hypothetical protein
VQLIAALFRRRCLIIPGDGKIVAAGPPAGGSSSAAHGPRAHPHDVARRGEPGPGNPGCTPREWPQSVKSRLRPSPDGISWPRAQPAGRHARACRRLRGSRPPDASMPAAPAASRTAAHIGAAQRGRNGAGPASPGGRPGGGAIVRRPENCNDQVTICNRWPCAGCRLCGMLSPGQMPRMVRSRGIPVDV